MKKLALIMAVAIVGVSAQAQTTWDFDVDPGATWNGWFESSVWSGGYGTADLRAGFTGSTLDLQSNVVAQDGDPGAWAGVDILASYYQEVAAGVSVGDTVTFDFFTVADNLSAQGYVVEGWIKVLDGFSSWNTYQYNNVTLGVGNQENLTTIVDGSGLTGAGVPVIQAGFSVFGVSDTTGSGTDTLAVNVIPEPATIGLVGIAGLGMFIARRRFKI